MKRVCVIHPVPTLYRLAQLQELSIHCQVDFLFSPVSEDVGFGKMPASSPPGVQLLALPLLTPLGKRVGMIQWGIARYIFQNKPTVIIAAANPRYLSFWTTALLAKVQGIAFYAHGHGLYKKRTRLSGLHRWSVAVMLKLVSGYIAYTPAVRDSFAAHGFPQDKVTVVENSIENSCTVLPTEKTGAERGILFIGRLRPENNLNLLIRVLAQLRTEGIVFTLHVVGSGEEGQALQEQWPNSDIVVWHGEVYDPELIRDISRKCLVGCYPGNVGLSVVHMMSLSLPVIIHDQLSAHGPEASYVVDGVTGLLYSFDNSCRSLYDLLCRLAKNPASIEPMRSHAFRQYVSLMSPPYAERLWEMIDNNENDDSRVKANQRWPYALEQYVSTTENRPKSTTASRGGD